MINKLISFMKNVLRIYDPVNISDSEIEEMIKNYSEKEEEEEEEPEPKISMIERSHLTANANDSAQSIVSFLITKNGNIDLNISWESQDELTAKNLATVLFLINSGTFENSCAELIVKMGQNDQRQMPFIRQVMIEWNNKRAGEPLIKPSEVFQFGTVGTGEE